MVFRIEVATRSELEDTRGRSLEAALKSQNLAVERIRVIDVYKIDGNLSLDETQTVAAAIADPIVEQWAVGALPKNDCDWIVSVGYLPGVTDNVGQTARVFIGDVLDGPQRAAPAACSVYTETQFQIWGATRDAARIASIARTQWGNPLIHRIQVDARDASQAALDLTIPQAGTSAIARAVPIVLPTTDAELLALSRQRSLALNLAEMKAIAAYYAREDVLRRRTQAGLTADPTDVELETLAQTWSEHCKHKIFAAHIRYTDEKNQTTEISSLFKTYIVAPTRAIEKSVDWLVSVFHDNAGVVRIDPETYLAFKVETHNSPSALDPYGGAITGIVGVNRDPFGTGIGAALLTNTWGYCFGPPDWQHELPQGLHHPRRIRDGVHHGVIDGGNQSGIPYSRGFECFDERFIGKPLVFCGTLGVMPSKINGHDSAEKKILPGDVVVMVGGLIGKDGIHGATFSSEALHGESPAQAVQIGDPITQKKMTDMLLEARDRGLYRTITDNGAGGLSSSVGELAKLSGGAELQLERAPLKYSGLQPWEILLSEAQERMTLAVPPDRLDALLQLARDREVVATDVGHFTDDGFFRLRYRENVVGELTLDFLHHGCPELALEARWETPHWLEPAAAGIDLQTIDVGETLLRLAQRLNCCGKVTKMRQYDHEVKGLSVIKPLVGVFGDVSADAAVMRVRHGSDRAIVLSDAINPWLSDLDAGVMAGYVVDLALRRQIAAGARLGQIAGLDNFCWPDPIEGPGNLDGKQKLAALVRACQSLSQWTLELGVPLISGKDSMKNDSTRGGVKISIPPTLLFSALGWIEQAQHALDLVIPRAGQLIYALGDTDGALGASELYRELAEQSGERRLIGCDAPNVDPQKSRAVLAATEELIGKRWITAAHAPHLGGLGMGLVTLCLAADLGLEIDLDRIPRSDNAMSTARLLFAESASRFLVAVEPDRARDLEAHCAAAKVSCACLGRATDERHLRIRRGSQRVAEISVAMLRQQFRGRLDALH